LKKAFGTSSNHFVDAALQQLIAAARLPLSGISEIAVNASLAFIEGAKPRDELLYPILTFDDGSVLWLKSVGTGTIDGTKTLFVGTVTVVGGKGRFHGVRGDGTLTGTGYTPLSVGADLVSDYTVHIEK
jgi:hypothetical protein